MAMSGLPPPRPSTIGANSLITLPACASFCLTLLNKDIDLVTDGCDKSKHIRSNLFVSSYPQSTKAASDTGTAGNITVSVAANDVKTSPAAAAAAFSFNSAFSFCNWQVVAGLQLRDFFELRCLRVAATAFDCIFLFTISFEGFLTSHARYDEFLIRSLLLVNLEESNFRVLPTWVPPQSSTGNHR